MSFIVINVQGLKNVIKNSNDQGNQWVQKAEEWILKRDSVSVTSLYHFIFVNRGWARNSFSCCLVWQSGSSNKRTICTVDTRGKRLVDSKILDRREFLTPDLASWQPWLWCTATKFDQWKYTRKGSDRNGDELNIDMD